MVPGLELLRIGVGFAILLVYAGYAGELSVFFGPDGWISAAAAHEENHSAWAWSPLFVADAVWAVRGLCGALLVAAAALALGWQTRFVKWAVLAGHLAFLHRAPAIQYGVDFVLASLLVILCLAPVGLGLSIDRIRAGVPPPAPGPWARACVRLARFQMAVCFFFAGATKLRGDAWWHGYAAWAALTNNEFGTIDLTWLAQHFWVINVLTWWVVVVELAYPFLVWGRARPWVLGAALLQHVGIAVLLGLCVFSFVMAVGHLVFVRRDWFQRATAWLRDRDNVLTRTVLYTTFVRRREA